MFKYLEKLLLCYSNFVINSTIRFLCYGLLFHTIALLACISLRVALKDKFLEIVFDKLPMNLRSDEAYINYIALDTAKIQSVATGPKFSTVNFYKERSQPSYYYDIELHYYSKLNDKNLFNMKVFKRIQEIETNLMNTNYMSSMCLLDYERPIGDKTFMHGCQFISLLSHVNLSNKTTDEIKQKIYDAEIHPKYKRVLKFITSKDAVIDSERDLIILPMIRSALRFGNPLINSSLTHEEFINKWLEPKLKSFASTDFEEFEFAYVSRHLYTEAVQNQVWSDLKLAIGSVLFIFCFILFQTRSIFLSVITFYSLFSSFAITVLIYRYVCLYRHFGIFHALSIFIMFGIGADDIFIYYNSWKSSKNYDVFGSLQERFIHCYKHAFRSMLVTSTTTFFAFIINTMSKILPTITFGLFSALLVLVNYINIITFFPCIVVLYHKYFEEKTWSEIFQFYRNYQKKDDVEEHSKRTYRINAARKLKMSLFIEDYFYPFIATNFVRGMVIVQSVIVVVISLIAICTISWDSHGIKYLRDSTMFGKATSIRSENFYNDLDKASNIRLSIVWGLKNQDFSSCRNDDFHCRGSLQKDPYFDLNTKAVQNAIKKFCKYLRLDNEETANLFIHTKENDDKDIKCLVEDMDQFFIDKNLTLPCCQKHILPALPYTEMNVNCIMESKPEVYKKKVYPRLDRHFEIALDYYAYDGYELNQPYFDDIRDHYGFENDLLNAQTVALSVRNKKYQFIYGNRLMYMTVTIGTTFPRISPLNDGKRFKNAWQTYLKNSMKDMPEILQKAFIVSLDNDPNGINPFELTSLQENFQISARYNILFGLQFALVIILLSNMDFRNSFSAFITIATSTVTVCGLLLSAGYKLGILESLNLSMVVGLSVDYVVHLTESYRTSPELEPTDRIKDALTRMSSSIISGALTTLGAACFLFFCKIEFFMQFGVFMFTIIGISVYNSLILLPILLSIFGARGEQIIPTSK